MQKVWCPGPLLGVSWEADRSRAIISRELSVPKAMATLAAFSARKKEGRELNSTLNTCPVGSAPGNSRVLLGSTTSFWRPPRPNLWEMCLQESARLFSLIHLDLFHSEIKLQLVSWYASVSCKCKASWIGEEFCTSQLELAWWRMLHLPEAACYILNSSPRTDGKLAHKCFAASTCNTHVVLGSHSVVAMPYRIFATSSRLTW